MRNLNIIYLLFIIFMCFCDITANAQQVDDPININKYIPSVDTLDHVNIDRLSAKLSIQRNISRLGSDYNPFNISINIEAPRITLAEHGFAFNSSIILPKFSQAPTSYSTMSTIQGPFGALTFLGSYPSTPVSYYVDSDGTKVNIGLGDRSGVLFQGKSVAIDANGTKYEISSKSIPDFSGVEYAFSKGIDKITFPNGEVINIYYFKKNENSSLYDPKFIVSNWGYGLEFVYNNNEGYLYYYNKSQMYCNEALLSTCYNIQFYKKLMSYKNSDIGNGGKRTVIYTNANAENNEVPYVQYDTYVVSGGTYNYYEIKNVKISGDEYPINYEYQHNSQQGMIEEHYVSSVSYKNNTWVYHYSAGEGSANSIAYGTYRYGSDFLGQLGSYHIIEGNQWVSKYHNLRDVMQRTINVKSREGDNFAISRDNRGNITSITQFAKTGSSLPSSNILSVLYSSNGSYPDGCQYRNSCNKPLSVTDAKGNKTDYTWSNVHGGILSAMAPPPTSGSARPLRLTSWIQRSPWLKNAAGALVASTNPIWVIASQTDCQTVAGSSSIACDANGVSIVTTYEYGANGTADAMLVKGVAVSSGGETLLTCYSYDVYGNIISKTEPRSGVSACP